MNEDHLARLRAVKSAIDAKADAVGEEKAKAIEADMAEAAHRSMIAERWTQDVMTIRETVRTFDAVLQPSSALSCERSVPLDDVPGGVYVTLTSDTMKEPQTLDFGLISMA